MATRQSAEAKLRQLEEVLAAQDERVLAEFQERIDMSWIYHDCALEGVVLSFHELKSAIDKDVVSDVSLIPTYDEIRAHKSAIDFIRETAAQKKKVPISIDLILKIREILLTDNAPISAPPPPPPVAVELPPVAAPATPGAPATTAPVPPSPPPAPTRESPWRKDTPVHRLYFHDIPSADKIPGEMKKIADWLNEPETKKLNAVRLASKLHFKLMQVYPFAKYSGKIARLAMNLVLLRAGFPPAIVHSTDRQRYYESLRGPSTLLHALITDSLENSIDSALKMFTERGSGRRAIA